MFVQLVGSCKSNRAPCATFTHISIKYKEPASLIKRTQQPVCDQKYETQAPFDPCVSFSFTLYRNN